jgi:hypothetical protein
VTPGKVDGMLHLVMSRLTTARFAGPRGPAIEGQGEWL